MAQAQGTGRAQTPEEFARQLGMTPGAPTETPAAGAVDPEQFAKQLGMTPEPVTPPKTTVLTAPNSWDTFWNSLYGAIPDVTGTLGGAIGGTLGFGAGGVLGAATVPGIGAVPGAPAGAALGAVTGAGVGGMVGRVIQKGIDVLGDRHPALQNPEGVGEAATTQMTSEMVGRAFGGLVDRFRGRLAPTDALGKERLETNKQYDLGLSVGDITDRPGIRRAEALATRGLGGYARQKRAQAKTENAAGKAITGILDSLGKPGTATEAGAAVQEAVQGAAARGARRVEGAVATQLAPKTGMGTAGETAKAGVDSARTSFARQSDAYGKMIREAPQVDMGPMHREAWQLFTDEILPKIEQNPTLGPNTKSWRNLMRRYQQASKRRPGAQFELSEEFRQALADEALDKATYAPLKVVRRVLTTPAAMDFPAALELRATLRDSGKGEGLIAGSVAEGLATYLETGSRTSAFKGLRGVLAEAHEPYIAAAEAYNTNRKLFQSAFIEKVAEQNPEAVLSSLTSAEGRINASRVNELSQVLLSLPKTWGSKEEIAAGQKAYDTLRAEWFRRDVLQDNVFGLSDRLKKVDPDVLRAWYPDLAGKNVLKQAEVTANAFESKMLASLAESDPSKIVQMIGSSPKNVNEFITRINALPGPVRKDELINNVRRAWTEDNLIEGDVTKLADRIAKTSPDTLNALFQSPEQKAALTRLRQLGNALSVQHPVHGMGAYESLGAISVLGNMLSGNVSGALTTVAGFEGIPQLVSWAIYHPGVHRYLLEAADTSTMKTSQTAAWIRAVNGFITAREQEQRLKTTQTPVPQ